MTKMACLFVSTSSQKFCRLTPIFLGEGELGAKQVASLFFDFIVMLFEIPSSVFYDKDVHFTT